MPFALDTELVPWPSRFIPSSIMSCMRRLPLCSFSVVLVAYFICAVHVAALPKPAASQASTQLRGDYISALATADRLLQAWQAADAESGLVLLTSHAKERATRDALDGFFSSEGPSAYEIGRGKPLRGGRYQFPVVLLTGTASGRRAHRRFSSILVVRTGDKDWAVDKLP